MVGPAHGPRGRASLTIKVDGSDVRVVVTDSGGGISPDDLEHVLDPFFSTKAEGTGPGLPTTAHGGSLKIESMPGDGTWSKYGCLAAAPS